MCPVHAGTAPAGSTKPCSARRYPTPIRNPRRPSHRLTQSANIGRSCPSECSSRTAPHQELVPISSPPCVQDTLRHPQVPATSNDRLLPPIAYNYRHALGPAAAARPAPPGYPHRPPPREASAARIASQPSRVQPAAGQRTAKRKPTHPNIRPRALQIPLPCHRDAPSMPIRCCCKVVHPTRLTALDDAADVHDHPGESLDHRVERPAVRLVMRGLRPRSGVSARWHIIAGLSRWPSYGRTTGLVC